MDSDDLARMYAQILNGVSKEESRFVTDDESGALWDQIVAEVEAIKAADPAAQFSVPNEVPQPPEATGTDPAAPATDPATDPAAPAAAPSPATPPSEEPE